MPKDLHLVTRTQPYSHEEIRICRELYKQICLSREEIVSATTNVPLVISGRFNEISEGDRINFLSSPEDSDLEPFYASASCISKIEEKIRFLITPGRGLEYMFKFYREPVYVKIIKSSLKKPGTKYIRGRN